VLSASNAGHCLNQQHGLHEVAHVRRSSPVTCTWCPSCGRNAPAWSTRPWPRWRTTCSGYPACRKPSLHAGSETSRYRMGLQAPREDARIVIRSADSGPSDRKFVRYAVRGRRGSPRPDAPRRRRSRGLAAAMGSANSSEARMPSEEKAPRKTVGHRDDRQSRPDRACSDSQQLCRGPSVVLFDAHLRDRLTTCSRNLDAVVAPPRRCCRGFQIGRRDRHSGRCARNLRWRGASRRIRRSPLRPLRRAAVGLRRFVLTPARTLAPLRAGIR
jgi:hypothetical protein